MRDVNEMLTQAEALILAGRGGAAIELFPQIRDGLAAARRAEAERCAAVCDAHAHAQSMLDLIPRTGVANEDYLRQAADTAEACAAAIRMRRGCK